MARRSSTSTGSARSSESRPAWDSGGSGDSGAGEGDSGTSAGPADNADTPNVQGADASHVQGADASHVQGADASQGTDTPPAKKRKRGPNKPKPGTFTVETKARMKQEQIIKLLIAQAVAQLGGDVANNMTLQVSLDGTCRPLGEVLPQGATLQFGTFVKAD